jgi:hypothetical protein
MASSHERMATSAAVRRGAVCACLAAFCLTATAARAFPQTTLPYAPVAHTPALPETPLRSLVGGSALPGVAAPHVDGISDQSLPAWDGSFSGSYFAGYFRAVWAGGLSSHITLARYVVQWNVMSGYYPQYRAELDAWYADVLSIGLTPDVSLASYDGVMPVSIAEYKARLEELLDRFTGIRYVEAWDEPNDTADLDAVTAAAYTNSASSLCRARGCTTIAGNFLDSQPNLVAYEREYERALQPASLSNWGIHPYAAVKTRSAATVFAFRASLPGGGTGMRIWFTEVGAYRCEGTGGHELRGEREQALDASWLVNRLMPAIEPAHVFYYEFLFKDRRPPPCGGSDSDTALYVPSSDPNAADVPRAAAGYVYDGRGTPFAYTGAATVTGPDRAILHADVYPGGFLNATCHFEYGATAAYGGYSAAKDVGSGLGRMSVSSALAGLRAGARYHYRIVAWNAEGAAYGSDGMIRVPMDISVSPGRDGMMGPR